MPANVLIVESDPSIAESISRDLKQAGFSPIVAQSPANARQLMSVVLPDLILIDWLLRNHSGASLANELRLKCSRKFDLKL